MINKFCSDKEMLMLEFFLSNKSKKDINFFGVT